MKRAMIGNVVSDKMQKTIVVQVQRIKQHRLYKKYIRRSKRFKVHDENSTAKVGDSVKFISCRPLSKEKSFRLVEILSSSKNSSKKEPKEELKEEPKKENQESIGS